MNLMRYGHRASKELFGSCAFCGMSYGKRKRIRSVGLFAESLEGKEKWNRMKNKTK